MVAPFPEGIEESMAMEQKLRIFNIFLALLTLSSSSLFISYAADPPSPSVYEILSQFGLPRGLLPDSVKSYSLSEDGDFEVNLENHCYVQFDYWVYYEKKITGKLKVGSITNLKGIQVQRFFLWFDVDEIRVDLPPSDSIYFTVGIINKRLDVDQFQTVHSCDKKVTFRNYLQVYYVLEMQTYVLNSKSDCFLVLLSEENLEECSSFRTPIKEAS